MSKTIIDAGKGEPRMKPDNGTGKILDVTRKDTPLAEAMNDTQREAFLRFVCEEETRLYGGLHHWREKMAKWERMSKMDYSDRKGIVDPNSLEPALDVFTYHNDSLGASEGFVDFGGAQAVEDVFGTKPWFAADPEGRNDPDLAKLVSKHSNWKLNQSDLEAAVEDAIKIAMWGGTVFVKSRWDRQLETYRKPSKPAAFSKATKAAYKTEAGEMIHTAEELEAMQADGDDVEWKEQSAEENIIVYDNSRSACLDYRDVAFDNKAPQLDLAFTSFYSRVRMGILDAIALYKIPEEFHAQLEHAMVGSTEEARAENGESNTTPVVENAFVANQQISLREGFVCVDPLRTGKIRIHCVFSPELNILWKLDYLANETPSGILPVFPIRMGKIPRRIFGIGYFEKFENTNNAVDRQYNAVLYRNKLAANVISGIHKDALVKPLTGPFKIDSREPVELAPDKKLSDFIEFAVIPDMNERSVELMNHALQMMQMRSGITSAAQGELKGVPNASTATGVNQLTSRGALLVKKEISQITKDIRPLANYNVDLIYANLDQDEVFVWGEGEASELLTIKAGDVRGLKMSVTLKLVQSQNQQKLANAQAGMQALAAYSALPEMDKTAARGFTVQSLEALGYSNAEDLVRQAVTDPAGILALVPPEVAPILQQALVAAGLMVAEAEPGKEDSAPVSEPKVGM